MSSAPSRGEVWLVDLNPTRGREQAGMRPCVVVSVDVFNESPAALVIVVPLTTKERRIRTHIRITPSEGGVRDTSFIKCEDVRSISTERLVARWGHLALPTMQKVEDALRILMGL